MKGNISPLRKERNEFTASDDDASKKKQVLQGSIGTQPLRTTDARPYGRPEYKE